MAKRTPEQEALYVVQCNVPRSELSLAAQLEYDRFRPPQERGEAWPADRQLAAARQPGRQNSNESRPSTNPGSSWGYRADDLRKLEIGLKLP